MAVAINNIPMIYPLARRLLRRTGLYPFSVSDGSSPADALSADEARDSRRRSHRYPHPLSLPTETKGESDEQVMLRPSSEGIMVTRETTVQSVDAEANAQALGYQVSTRGAGDGPRDANGGGLGYLSLSSMMKQ